MKKLLLVIAVVLFGTVNLHAQDFQFGIKGGLNFATITGDNTLKSDMVTAFHVGGMLEIPISEKFSVQPEILFSGAGYSFEDNITALNYLDIPIIAKYYVTKGLSLEAGPQIGFLLSAKTEDLDVRDAYDNVNLSLATGVGYKLDNGLHFGARYNFGLTSMYNLNDIDDKNTIGVFQLSVGYFF
ncbi:porin family protein [Tamlana sp. 2_MG-2023]|uniref:porin family protein n=1 Tax=unclassified Tamlana TaxID=2614803 RepID=UPI0026E2BC46|nr:MULTISPECIES: porin family protein [unclassified Tamlana]MDO6760615.1 porin family protein [Tamlana sp. 2_MG-2023]MDO6790871.1 porin family protein [Tamlana sp. 1_MG-2023]